MTTYVIGYFSEGDLESEPDELFELSVDTKSTVGEIDILQYAVLQGLIGPRNGRKYFAGDYRKHFRVIQEI